MKGSPPRHWGKLPTMTYLIGEIIWMGREIAVLKLLIPSDGIYKSIVTILEDRVQFVDGNIAEINN